jgi:hypothetical protein
MNNSVAQWTGAPACTIRRGHFWIPGDRVVVGERTCQHGLMYVEWEAPETVTRKWPIVLMHGGGGAGRPGLVDNGETDY